MASINGIELFLWVFKKTITNINIPKNFIKKDTI